MKLLGFKPVDFTNRDGDRVTGNTLYVGYLEDGVTGYVTEKFFVGNRIEMPKVLSVNDNLDISFNQKGKILSVKKA